MWIINWLREIRFETHSAPAGANLPITGGAGVCRRTSPLPEPLTLDLGDWPSTPYRGPGWAGDEIVFAATANWATAPTATLFFPVRGPGDRRLILSIAPFSYPGMPTQQLTLSLNDQTLAQSYSLREGWQEIEAQLPADYLSEGLNRLTLHFAHTAQPRQVLPASRAIGSTGRETPLDLEVNSGKTLPLSPLALARRPRMPQPTGAVSTWPWSSRRAARWWPGAASTPRPTPSKRPP